jgi:tetratricopeptide (TPR) repeat protein
MPVDPYALCPCGSGKKLKFCCGDVAGEIEKIHRMIEGDQPRAALRHVEQTLAKNPGKASLLDLKAALELSLEETDAARATIAEFVSDHADSPTAHACQALLQAETGEATAAVGSLQRALELIDHDMPQRVLEAIGIVGRALLAAGHVVAAQAHLWLHAAIAPKEDVRSRELLVGLNHYSGLPLILRDRLYFRPWPTDVPWAKDALQASQLADHGRWQRATAVIDQLGQQYGAIPTLVYNRALLGGWLADERSLVAGLHAFAQMDVPLDDAVEAEAVAQLLDPDQRDEKLDSVIQIYEINDLDALVARLSSDSRVEPFNVDPASLPPDQPRPRNTYILLDKPTPAEGTELTRSDVPRLAGVVAVFGRQTDRRERLELTIDKGPGFEAMVTALRSIAADALGEMLEEKVVGHVSTTEQALNFRWHFPRDTPPDVRRRLSAEERRAAIVERWPEVRKPALGGKTAREAAADPELRIPLMAAVAILEQGGSIARTGDAIAELRQSLGLPEPEPIEGTEAGVGSMPLVRVQRLKVAEASDDALVQLYHRAMVIGADAAVAWIAQEVVRRPSLADRIAPSDAYRRMISAEADLDRALALVDEARQRSTASGESTATWDLTELQLHIASGNAPRFQEVLERIERSHLDDPQVAQELYRILYESGMIRPETVPGMPMETIDEESAAMATAPEPTGGSTIWTPDSERPAGKKSSLWTPS